MNRRAALRGLALLSLAPFATGMAHGQDKWPSRPVKIMVGFAAGGGVDGMARMAASRLAERLGQPVVVENKAGATGTICSEFVARSAPDGYTLQLAHLSSNVIAALLLAKGKFHPVNDFTPIVQLGSSPQVLVHHPRHRFGGVGDLIAYAKRNPGKLSFASAGVGGAQHIAGEDLKLRAGIDLLHVPFKGTSEAIIAVIAGDVDMTFTSMTGALPQAKANKVVLLAVASPNRLADRPDLPAIAEAVPGFESSTWTGLAGPRGLPVPVVDRVSREVLAMLRTPEVVKRFDELDAEVSARGPREFAEFWRSEVARYEKVIAEARIQA